MYRGRKFLGEEIRIGCQCAAGRVPGAPTAAPTYRVYTEAGVNVVNGSLPPTERYITTGLFEYMLPLNASFSAGRHFVSYRWTISGTQYAAIDSFQITAGGSTNGMVNSMFFLDRPDGDWITVQTDSGGTKINRGPHI